MAINWENIRVVDTSQREGFEELICQLARRENIEDKLKYRRIGKPDAGVECYWILANGEKWAWQAKYFRYSLTSGEWGQLDESVKTALEKHFDLKKYIIAIPMNPPDGKDEDKTSMLGKWDERVKKWEGWAKDKGLDVIFEAWWSSDIIERLSKPENKGLTYFFFNKEEFTDEWCKEQNGSSIANLGERYTAKLRPELNVKLEIAKIFDGISRNKNFEVQIKELFDGLITKGKEAVRYINDFPAEKRIFEEMLNQFYELFMECDFYGIDRIPYKEFNGFLAQLGKLSNQLSNNFLDKRAVEEEAKHQERKYSDPLGRLGDFEDSLENFEFFISSTSAKLSNQPALLLDGDGGVGKSHLLADIVESRNSEGKHSLLMLGQHFVTQQDPWTQIFADFKFRGSTDEFLGALNSKAEAKRARLILFIDALNEGQGEYFWPDHIRSFIQKILKYEWLGMVVSIRTSYKELIFPQGQWNDDLVIHHTHKGFGNAGYEAIKLFFTVYKIELPSTPMLYPEFQKPLFLKLFCEGLKKANLSKISDGLSGITSVMNFYIQGVNSALAKPARLKYSKEINVVQEAIDVVITEKIDTKALYVPYERAFHLIENIFRRYSNKRGIFLDELISEGIFSKNLFWESSAGIQGIYFPYERFENHLIASYLLKQTSNIEKSFSTDGELFYLVKDEHACHLHKGLIEAFSIQLPEKTGKEFFEYVPHLKDNYAIVESFVQSLLWRKTDTISERLLSYINTSVFRYPQTRHLFFDTLLSVTAIPEHYFNASSLHKHLMKFKLADRDAWWNEHIKNQTDNDSPAGRLIDWAWSRDEKDHVSDESIKLVGITLSWFLASTNRKLRDSATKALINLLMNRINVLLEVLKEFENVNDPYIYERLFAVAYGCAMRTKQRDTLPDLSLYIYQTIFDKDGEIYPHILLRDYARGVIEYTLYLGYNLEIGINKVRPPYKSSLPKKFPTDKQIDRKYKFDSNAQDFKDYFWGQNDILNSITTENGRGTSMYGDFGRYVFQDALESWNLKENALSNLAIQWIFEKYGYDVEKHGKFDRDIGSGRWRDTDPHERIGKKYQWLALHEILARVSDNFKKYESNYSKKVELYEGPWEPSVRDIDPTLLIKHTGSFGKDEPSNYWWNKENYANWDVPNVDWLKKADDLPNAQNFINLVDDKNEEWLALNGYPRWMGPKTLGSEKWDTPRKQMWYQIRSYLVKTKDYKKFKDWAIDQDFMGRWMPESHDRYEMFSREYYWSPAYKFFQQEYYEGHEWKKVLERRSNKVVVKAMVTSESFLWEEGFDYSKEETISFLKPCCDIYKRMNLHYSDREGEFLDEKNEVICFDPSVYYNCASFLIIKKAQMIKYLKENDLQIVWTVLGEKNIIGLHSLEGTGMRWLKINGVYYLQDGTIEGKIRAESD